MADFDVAYHELISLWEDEGMTGKITSDAGGVTKWGISTNAFPSTDIKELTLEDAKELTKRFYWQFDQFQNQRVANKMLQMGFNLGFQTGLQLLFCSLEATFTGVTITPRTSFVSTEVVMKVNNVFAPTLLASLCSVQLAHYAKGYRGLWNVPRQLYKRALHSSFGIDNPETHFKTPLTAQEREKV